MITPSFVLLPDLTRPTVPEVPLEHGITGGAGIGAINSGIPASSQVSSSYSTMRLRNISISRRTEGHSFLRTK